MIPEKKQSVIIVAGGKGLRAGGELPKQFQPIGGEPMLIHTIKAFYDYDYRIRIVVVLPEGLEPPITVPKTGVISISPQEHY